MTFSSATAPKLVATVGLDEPSEDEFEQVLYHITHDVRAALRAIQTLPDWIREDLEKCQANIPCSVFEDLELLKIQTARADQILIDLRTYSRIGRRSDRPSNVSLADAFDIAGQNVENIDRFTVTLDLEAPYLFAPRNDILTIAHALVSNAVKHHGASNGKIWIYSAQTPQCVSLFVEDDGPGIDPQHHERVFQLMTTLRSRDECEGSGVGLALVSKIMRTLDGQVAIVTPRKLGGTCIAMHFGPACSSKKAA